MQELQPGRNHLNDAVDEITDGLCEVVRYDPVLRMTVEVETEPAALFLLERKESGDIEPRIDRLSIFTVRAHLEMAVRSR